MNAWNERVLAADPFMTKTARELVDVISRFYSVTASGYCAFHDVEAAGLIGVTSAQLRAARQELERKNFLRALHAPGNKPRYALRQPGAVSSNDGEAA